MFTRSIIAKPSVDIGKHDHFEKIRKIWPSIGNFPIRNLENMENPRLSQSFNNKSIFDLIAVVKVKINIPRIETKPLEKQWSRS